MRRGRGVTGKLLYATCYQQVVRREASLIASFFCAHVADSMLRNAACAACLLPPPSSSLLFPQPCGVVDAQKKRGMTLGSSSPGLPPLLALSSLDCLSYVDNCWCCFRLVTLLSVTLRRVMWCCSTDSPACTGCPYRPSGEGEREGGGFSGRACMCQGFCACVFVPVGLWGWEGGHGSVCACGPLACWGTGEREGGVDDRGCCPRGGGTG